MSVVLEGFCAINVTLSLEVQREKGCISVCQSKARFARSCCMECDRMCISKCIFFLSLSLYRVVSTYLRTLSPSIVLPHFPSTPASTESQFYPFFWSIGCSLPQSKQTQKKRKKKKAKKATRKSQNKNQSTAKKKEQTQKKTRMGTFPL